MKEITLKTDSQINNQDNRNESYRCFNSDAPTRFFDDFIHKAPSKPVK